MKKYSSFSNTAQATTIHAFRDFSYNLVFEGHSFFQSHCEWPIRSVLDISGGYYNSAWSESLVADVVARAATVDSKLISETSVRKNILLLWIGINDYSTRTAQQISDDIKAYVLARVAAGWTVFIYTISPFVGDKTADFIVVPNTMMRNELALNSKVFVVDTDLEIGWNDGANRYYTSDGLHPTGFGIISARNLFVNVLKTAFTLATERVTLGNELIDQSAWCNAGLTYWDHSGISGITADGTKLIFDTTSGNMIRINSLTVGKRYRISITISRTAGYLNSLGELIPAGLQVCDGLNTVYTYDHFVFGSTSICFIFSAFSGTITSLSMKEVTQD